MRLDADLLDLLRLGAAQLLYMQSVPAYAGIAQTVEQAKRRHGIGASKLANAVLRRLDRERDELDARRARPIPSTCSRSKGSHPRWLVARWVERWGIDETRRLLEANNHEPPLVARPYHAVREQLEAMLEAAGVHVEDAPLARDSIVLSSAVSSFTELGPFRQGLFHLQDPASTLVTQYACVPTGAFAADLCAAPGGKSIELSRNAAQVFASDLSLARLQRVHRERAPPRDRHAPRVRGRREQSGDPANRSRARRRAVHGHGDVPPPSRRAVAPQDLGRRRDVRRIQRAILRTAAERREARRTAGVQHLFARARGERRAGGSVPRRTSRTGDWSRRRTESCRRRCSTLGGCASFRSGTVRTARSPRGCGERADELSHVSPRVTSLRGDDRQRISRRVSVRRVRDFSVWRRSGERESAERDGPVVRRRSQTTRRGWIQGHARRSGVSRRHTGQHGARPRSAGRHEGAGRNDRDVDGELGIRSTDSAR